MDLRRRMYNFVLSTFSDVIWKGPSGTNTLFLTFDDGPYPPITRRVLQILDQYKVPAVFFLSGEKIQEYQNELPILSYDSHRLGNHGFNHEPIFFKSPTQLISEIKTTDELILKYFHKHSLYYRPPYGIWRPGMNQILKACSKRLLLWSLPANDFKWPAERVFNYLNKNAACGDIIVFHDSQKAGETVLQMLPRFLEHALKNHWRFGLL